MGMAGCGVCGTGNGLCSTHSNMIHGAGKELGAKGARPSKPRPRAKPRLPMPPAPPQAAYPPAPPGMAAQMPQPGGY